MEVRVGVGKGAGLCCVSPNPHHIPGLQPSQKVLNTFLPAAWPLVSPSWNNAVLLVEGILPVEV